MHDLLIRNILNNPLYSWIYAITIVLVVNILVALIKKYALKRFRRFSATTQTGLDDVLSHIVSNTKTSFILVLSLYWGSLAVKLPDWASNPFKILTILSVILQSGFWLIAIGDHIITKRVQPHYRNTSTSLLRTAIWILVLLLCLDNIPGIQINALITSLGITGLAVSLAAQSVLGDIFAAISIALDKPFEVGDTISLGGDYIGIIDKIGWKSTRIISLMGEQLIIGNADLMRSRIRNYKIKNEHMETIPIRIGYQTPYEKLEQIPDVVKNVVQSEADTDFVRAQFRSFSPACMNFEIVYLVNGEISNIRYVALQQRINMELYKQFEILGVQLV